VAVSFNRPLRQYNSSTVYGFLAQRCRGNHRIVLEGCMQRQSVRKLDSITVTPAAELVRSQLSETNHSNIAAFFNRILP
jgi:hypothetical protein